ncbi:MAG: hypothetical protein AB7U61_14395, partial [Methylocystis sp.]
LLRQFAPYKGKPVESVGAGRRATGVSPRAQGLASTAAQWVERRRLHAFMLGVDGQGSRNPSMRFAASS